MKKFDQEIELLQQSIDKAAAQRDAIGSENAPRIAEIKGKMDTITASIDQATAERAGIIALVPKPLLRTYDHILKRRKNGNVLSFVTGDARTCSVCFKILEPQLINEIRKANRVMTCQNCGSIFIWKGETKTEG